MRSLRRDDMPGVRKGWKGLKYFVFLADLMIAGSP